MKHFIYHFRKDNLLRFWAEETFRFSKLDQIKSPKRKAFGMFNKTLRKCKVNGAAFHGRAIVLANNRTNYYSIKWPRYTTHNYLLHIIQLFRFCWKLIFWRSENIGSLHLLKVTMKSLASRSGHVKSTDFQF